MITPSNPDAVQIDLEVIVSESDNVVYVKLAGFEDNKSAEEYADFLVENLPLMLFRSEIKH
jgi:hypothetical protein